ncbi:rRNA-processing protein UTP23 homolog [Tachypleus tridentatus]|uniref:rRNA-processing protein UTP23 homolog n=1 Tax=Tachypleus tridentatus TaxID=6853 RepID=UPI003FD1958E
MKIKRQKRLHRNLNFYRNNFGFREPYQVLLDATFCQSALKYKVNIKEQLPNYLEGEVKLMTTSCVVTETEKLGPALFGAMLVVKQFHVRKCGHEKKPIVASECLYSMVKNNSDHYFIATQDPELSKKIRNVAGTPLLYMNFNAIILEKPSDFNVKAAEENTLEKLNASNFQSSVLDKLKKESELGEQKERKSTKKRKKVSGPNPLSCKKKKVKPNAISKTKEENLKKRKRKRVKIAKHVKYILSTVSQ